MRSIYSHYSRVATVQGVASSRINAIFLVLYLLKGERDCTSHTQGTQIDSHLHNIIAGDCDAHKKAGEGSSGTEKVPEARATATISLHVMAVIACITLAQNKKGRIF